ncbi:hypothetical protein M513_13661 [Trichuris suis]|uniref:Uncharacterized protein n=1 Tax=Trichuris suis TaxID=68888 RepID=A0A085LKG5_9BILA|nr:hypothetical protein M513_13661 [Trichuris suis]
MALRGTHLMGLPVSDRRRPPQMEPHQSIEVASKASVVTKRAANCSGQPDAYIIYHELNFLLRRLKEAYIRRDVTYNRDMAFHMLLLNLTGVSFCITNHKK